MADILNSDVIARLDKLERENKFLKRCAAFVMVVGGAVLMMAQSPARPRTLEAEKLIIRYPNGKEGIVLETGNIHGNPGAGIRVSSPNDKIRMEMSATRFP
jgi:hypothetical protein